MITALLWCHILVNFPSYKNYILNWDFDSKIKIFHLFVLWRNTTKNFYYAEKYLFLFLMEEIIRYTYYSRWDFVPNTISTYLASGAFMVFQSSNLRGNIEFRTFLNNGLWLEYLHIRGGWLLLLPHLDIPVSQKYRNTIGRLEYQDWYLVTTTLMWYSKIWYVLAQNDDF